MCTRAIREHARSRGWARVAMTAALAAGGHWLAGCTAEPLPQDPADAAPAGPADAAPQDPALASLFVSGIEVAIAPVPGTTEYEVDLGFLMESVTVTATAASPGDTLAIAGVAVPDGTPSAPLAMAAGDNMVDVVVENSLGRQRTYRLTLRRAGEIAQHAYCKASSVVLNGHFGSAMAISGSRLVVLAEAVYVLRRSGTSWAQEDLLTPAGAPDWRGGLALSGDTLAIQADGDESAPDSGGVYVLRHDGAAWQQEAHLTASNAGAGDGFGASLALAGDILVVGAPDEDSAATGTGGDQDDDTAGASGAVYVFRRTGSIWQQEAYLKASNTGAGDRFGTDVALSGDVIAVGAPRESSAATGVDGDQESEGALYSGAVYVFRRDGSSWQQEAYVKPSNTDVDYLFGQSVALSGDTLASGAMGEASRSAGIDGDQTDRSFVDSGAVYVFRRGDSSWQQEAYIKASNPEQMASFGFQVGLAGDTLAVGAPYESSLGAGIDPDPMQGNSTFSSAAYLFHRSGTTWQQDAYIKASNSAQGDNFSRTLALSSDTLAVGSPQESSASTGIGGDQTNSGAANSGAVYIFH